MMGGGGGGPAEGPAAWPSRRGADSQREGGAGCGLASRPQGVWGVAWSSSANSLPVLRESAEGCLGLPLRLHPGFQLQRVSDPEEQK